MMVAEDGTGVDDEAGGVTEYTADCLHANSSLITFPTYKKGVKIVFTKGSRKKVIFLVARSDFFWDFV